MSQLFYCNLIYAHMQLNMDFQAVNLYIGMHISYNIYWAKVEEYNILC